MLDKNAIYIVQNHVKAGLVDTAEQYPLRIHLAGKEKSAGAKTGCGKTLNEGHGRVCGPGAPGPHEVR
jgi:hypothetical protein